MISKKTVQIITVLMATSIISFGNANAERVYRRAKNVKAVSAGLSGVCTNVGELGGDQYKSNSPVRSRAGDNSSGIVRFALNPTLIFVSSQRAKFSTANAYDKKGNLLISGAQRLGCDAKPRGVCFTRYKADESSYNTAKVRSAAIKNTRSPEIFWRVAPNLCIRVPDAGQCYNVKSRELCAKGKIVK